MTNDIKGLETWEGEAKEWSRYAGSLKMRAGSGLIDALESWYTQWQTKPTPRNKRETMTWRLRLHLKWNGEPEFLKELDETFNIGLFNEEVGQTYWSVPPEVATGFTSGYNWRRDSGTAIRGKRTIALEKEAQENLEEMDD